jgi:hypothetical protein
MELDTVATVAAVAFVEFDFTPNLLMERTKRLRPLALSAVGQFQLERRTSSIAVRIRYYALILPKLPVD